MKIISLELLQRKHACGAQRVKFSELFGNEVEITEALCVQYASVFDFDWAASNLLTAPAYAEYEKVKDSAYAEYKKVRDSANAEYEKVKDSAEAEYEKIRDSAEAEYEKVKDSAYAEYKKAIAPAYAEYEKAIAIIFAKLFLSQEESIS